MASACGTSGDWDAIGQIQAQAAMIAARLKENVGEIKTLNVNMDGQGPMPPGPAYDDVRHGRAAGGAG